LLDITDLSLPVLRRVRRLSPDGAVRWARTIFDALFDKLLLADGIVIGSPVYIFTVSAQLKVFNGPGWGRPFTASACWASTGRR